MPATDISPNVDNYFVGAGIVSWSPTGPTGTYIDIGNVSKFELSVVVTALKHYSSRTGIRRKDDEVVTQMDATVALTMDELTANNLALHLLATDPGGATPIMLNIGDTPEIGGALRLVGTNDVGAMVQVDLPSILVKPTGALGLINNGAWGEIVLEAEVNCDVTTGVFGRLAWDTGGVLQAYP